MSLVYHALFLVCALMRLSRVTSELTDPSSVQVGDEICYEGFVMDYFCIERGTLLDNPDVVTLEGPDQHSVHCLIDVDPCRESPYYLLADPMVEGGLYTGAFQVDADGQERLIEIARDVGTCSTCTGNGNLQKGFRAEVRGTVTALGDGSIPHTIAVTDAAPSNSMTTVCEGSGSSGGTGGFDDGDTTGETEEDDSDEESLDDGETSGLAEQSNSDDDNDTAIQVVAAISTACIVAVALLSMYGNAFQKDKTIQSGVVSLPQNAKLSAVDESTDDA